MSCVHFTVVVELYFPSVNLAKIDHCSCCVCTNVFVPVVLRGLSAPPWANSWMVSVINEMPAQLLCRDYSCRDLKGDFAALFPDMLS